VDFHGFVKLVMDCWIREELIKFLEVGVTLILPYLNLRAYSAPAFADNDTVPISEVCTVPSALQLLPGLIGVRCCRYRTCIQCVEFKRIDVL